jgi:acetolactate synthase-1/2/3 large subunit
MAMNEQLRSRLLQPDVLSGSEILLRCLLLEGVECVFGYPGGAVLYVYDALYGMSGLKHVLARHEQGAIHAADGYARASGKVGVCIATSGPGATNLITGIATAQMDSTPLVVITGNVALSAMGTDAFQEADIIGMTLPITKHSYLVRRTEDIPRIVREAFHLASTGRKGPVLIDLPKDISANKIPFRYWDRPIDLPGYRPKQPPDEAALDAVFAAIGQAERPLILAGGGIVHAGAHEELKRFVRRTNIPVTTTLLGLSGFSSADERWLGMPGMHGTFAANMALQHCDLLLGFGARFDDRVTMRTDGFAPQARIVHLDIDPAEIGRTVRPALSCVGDLKDMLDGLNRRAEAAEAGYASPPQWLGQIKRWQAEHPLRYDAHSSGLKPQAVIEMISETTGGEAIVTTDVGQHQMWTAQFYRFKSPRAFITSGGMGTMGFGLPAAIGAQMAFPDRTVVSINGDGGIQMCAQELAVCAILNLPVKIAVINNRVLGMVRQWQEIIYDRRYSHIDLAGSPDFVKLAEAYGVKGLRARTMDEARSAWTEALRTPGPVLVDFVVDREENVYPMVLAGQTIDRMILGD